MSYILDALKKSEQERGHGNIPDVQTVHSSSLSYRNEKKAYWPYILIIAVILNLFAISYFIFNKEKAAESPATAKTTANNNSAIVQTGTKSDIADEDIELPATATTAETTAKPDNENTLPTASAAAPAIKEIPAEKPVATNTRPETPSISSGSDIIGYHELPESIKQQLPAIIISAHVYSSNPLQRSIVINNNFMEEGEYVIDGLILHEITTDGAVFNYQGTLFNYGVVSGWQ